MRVMISGGGTGGHIFPAISIADKLSEVNPSTEILFVGACGRMEMEKVPQAGYRIEGLPIAGLQRGLSFSALSANLSLPFKLLSSVNRAGKIIRDFKPDVVVGVGGYASAPLLWKASGMKIPTLIQEQNGFAGLTNRLLGKRVGSICVAYEGMERFFPAEKIIFSGNPIRPQMHPYSEDEVRQGLDFYGLTRGRRHLLVVGGSLGAGTLNRAMCSWIEAGCPGGEDVEVIWQCGRFYKASVDSFMQGRDLPNIRHTDFIARMDLAYAASDAIISRAGASSVSEICAAAKAAIFVPSPNVAEDHQTHNALSLVRKDAALMVRDADAPATLMNVAMDLVHDDDRIRLLQGNAAAMAKMDAAQTIVDQIYALV